MKFLSKKSQVKLDSKGFTLIELMVVVGIIGLLAVLAVPQFNKFTARSRQSEAKLQLSAIYTSLQAAYADFGLYPSCIGSIGFAPTGITYYALGFDTAHDYSAVGAVNDTAVQRGAPAACDAAAALNIHYFIPAVGAGAVPTAAQFITGSFTSAAAGTVNGAGTAFDVAALGYIDSAFTTPATGSRFLIDETKTLVNENAGY